MKSKKNLVIFGLKQSIKIDEGKAVGQEKSHDASAENN